MGTGRFTVLLEVRTGLQQRTEAEDEGHNSAHQAATVDDLDGVCISELKLGLSSAESRI
jgi:hypothetical protein